MLDTLFTNGAIAVKEKKLLGERLLRLAEMTAEDAFRALLESGFGSGAEEVRSPADSERLCAAEEIALDAFIREYAPSRAILCYLLSPRDFHNAKALVKAERLGTDAGGMLAPEGLYPIKELKEKLAAGEMFPEIPEEATGAEIGAAFDKALYAHLFSVCKSGVLKRMLAGKADMLNLLTAFRAPDKEYAEKLYIGGGKLSAKQLEAVFGEGEAAVHAFDGTPYEKFYAECFTARENGVPYTAAERSFESFEAEYFAARRFELQNKEPFLYYVFRRRAEISNVRILLVCLNAGLKEQEIKKRIR